MNAFLKAIAVSALVCVGAVASAAPDTVFIGKFSGTLYDVNEAKGQKQSVPCILFMSSNGSFFMSFANGMNLQGYGLAGNYHGVVYAQGNNNEVSMLNLHFGKNFSSVKGQIQLGSMISPPFGTILEGKFSGKSAPIF